MLALIGGTGFGKLDEFNVIEKRWVETPFGECSAPILIGDFGGRRIAFLARHGDPHRIAPHLVNYRANLYALKQLGVEDIIAINAVGGINENFPPEALAVPDQIIDYTYGRAHTIFDGVHCDTVDHIDFTNPYSIRLRNKLIAHAAKLSLPVLENGVYGATQGPRLETAAEIKKLAADGCDMVGMTGMPEAALARELELEYACLAISVNWAAGMTENVITMEDIHRALVAGGDSARRLLLSYMKAES